MSARIHVSAQEAGRSVREAGEQLTVSDARMRDMRRAMTEMSDNSAQIGEIIKAIEDIAFQTNIPALNAAVKAARGRSREELCRGRG